MQKNNNKRVMGFWMCTALVVGNMIGSGIFMLPASMAPYGMNSLYGWAVTVAGALLLAFVFARLAKAISAAGGPYVYPRMAFGEGAGFVVAWGYWVAVWTGNVAIAVGTVSYLSELLPIIKTSVAGPAIATLTVLWLLTAINYRGTKVMGGLQIATTLLKLLPLLAIVALGFWLFGTGQVNVVRVESQPISFDAVSSCAILALWGFLGLETATVPGDCVIDPQKNIPRATLWGTLVTAALYVIACTTILMLIPGKELAVSNAPFADVARQFWGSDAALLLSLFAFISGFGALNGWILVHAEMPAVMARAGVFPKIFAHESKYHTPGSSLLITGVLASIFVLMNFSKTMVETFNFIVLVSTSANLFMYFAVSVSAIKLARKGVVPAKPLFYLLVVLACVYSLWALYGAGISPFLWSFGLFALGLPLFAWMKWQRKKQGIEITEARA